jgi:hypothetical protein
MEINITQFFTSGEYSPMDYSASVAEIGNNAGKITWNNALESSEDYSPLDTPEKIEAFRGYIQEFGAWSEEEITDWTVTECSALFYQLVSGDIREAGLDLDNPDWEEYEANDNISHNIFSGIDGEIYYYLGS